MTTKLKNNTIPRVISLENQESNEVFNRNADVLVTALIHKERCKEKSNNSIKQSGLTCPLTNSKDIAPRVKVSINFAAEQWFRILLVHLNGKNSKFMEAVEPMPSAI